MNNPKAKRTYRRLGNQVVSWYYTWLSEEQSWLSHSSDSYEEYNPAVHGERQEGEIWTRYF
jgi:hypothetical protein